jgi:hypothetical protein
MGDRAKGRAKGTGKKVPKAPKAGRRPHELRQQEYASKKPL